tara:strand:- start:639 stop:767 length:129 start_codon:yes stop_codon:yes gene_type:complete
MAINLEKQLSSPNFLQLNFTSFPSLSNGFWGIKDLGSGSIYG